ncbi:hypothetical protein JOC45_001091 [Gordonia hydrophobica]|nr:hypothetical protein [Gordonia hydrophobica]
MDSMTVAEAEGDQLFQVTDPVEVHFAPADLV